MTASRLSIQSFAFTALLLASSLAAGCRSRHVEIDVTNRTGAPIQQLEVDYPSASFGADRLDNGVVFHYRIQIQGSGPLKLQYTSAQGQHQQIIGPALSEGEQGTLQIDILPGGKAEFHPQFVQQN